MYFTHEKLNSAFSMFDKNGNGTISLKEICEVLNVKEEDEKKIKEILSTIDINNDGEIDYNEFLILMGK